MTVGGGETFGRYRLHRVLGRGGMGVVHAAHDTMLDREVALKIVAPHLADDAAFRARFQHEAAVLARLDSDRIVRIYDHGEHDGSLFIVTQLVEGGDLQRLVASQGQLQPALAVDIVAQVLDGLHDAHAVGVVHRDIKPANVLLRQRQGEVEAFLCDFGIATTAGTGFTATGGVAGSLPYMAPERHQGSEATPRSDVYAVGCVLWHGLTGSAPYVGTDAQVLLGHVEGPVRQLPGKDPFSKRMNAVLATAMAKDPRRRYPGARAMLAEVEQLRPLAPGSIQLPGATSIRPVALRRRRRWAPALAATVGVVGVLSAVTVAALAGGGGRGGAQPPAPPVTLVETEIIEGFVVGPSGTFSPSPSAPTVSPGGRAPEAPPVAPGARGEAPAPAPSALPPAPAPAPRYKCWNGPVTTNLAACAPLTGAAAMRWLFPGAATLGCLEPRAYDASVERWGCALYRNGVSVNVSVDRWTSAAAGRAATDDWFAPATTWQVWSVAGARAGLAKSGRNVRNTHSGAAYFYDGTPWSLSMSGASASDVAWMYSQVNRFRPPGDLRGVPCSEVAGGC